MSIARPVERPSYTVIMNSQRRNISDYPDVESFSYTGDITTGWIMNPSAEKQYVMTIKRITLPSRKHINDDKYLMVSLVHSGSPVFKHFLHGESAPGFNRANFLVEAGGGSDKWTHFRQFSSPVRTIIRQGEDTFTFKIFDSQGFPLKINEDMDPTLPENQVTIIFELTPI